MMQKFTGSDHGVATQGPGLGRELIADRMRRPALDGLQPATRALKR